MKILITLLALLCIKVTQAQVSVYDCQSNTEVTQTIINNAGSVFQQQCVEFPNTQTFLFNGTFDKEIRANTSIKIEPGFTAGSFTSTSAEMKLSITPKSDFDVVVMNYPNLMNVLKLEKFELGVSLPTNILTKVNNFVTKANVALTEKINPFLDWELDVEATFTHTTSGTVKKIDAFYYREYERNVTDGVWDEMPTNFPMRARFSPPETGKWQCVITIKTNNTVVAQSAPFLFSVVTSSNPGYVTVHPNNRNLQQNNRMIFPVGINFDGPIKGIVNGHIGPNGDIYGPEDMDVVITPQNFVTYHNDIVNYKNQGGRFIRTLQNPWGALIEFTEKGNYYNRLHYAWEQDRLIDYCEANDILIHFNMLHQEPFMKYGNYHLFDWDWSHYNADGTYFAQDIFPAYCYANEDQKEPYEMFLLEDDLKYHEQRTRYYVSRYGYSTSIYIFELLSEPWHVNELSGQTEPFQEQTTLGANVRAAVQNYHERMSSYIKQTLGHTEHLVGIDVFTATINNSPNYLDPSITHGDIDVISFNPYSQFPDKLVVSKNQNIANTEDFIINTGENSMYKTVKTIQDIANKPVLIAEGGAGDGVDDCSNFAQQYVDMMTLGFTGIGGYNSWIGQYSGHEGTWQSIINAQNHMNGYDVIDVLSNNAGLWKQGREIAYFANFENKEAKELQYYLSWDQEMGAGYVKNRTYNAYTKRTSEDPTTKCMELGATLNQDLKDFRNLMWDEKTVTMQGLKLNTDYLVHWFEFQTGTYLGSGCESTYNDTKIPLKHPQLYVHPDAVAETGHLWPVLWFIVEQNNCNDNLMLSNVVNNEDLVFLSTEPTTENNAIDIPTTDFVSVSPNPFNETLTIKSSTPIGHIKLINNLNQVVYETHESRADLVINTDSYKKGIYQLIFIDSSIVYKVAKL